MASTVLIYTYGRRCPFSGLIWRVGCKWSLDLTLNKFHCPSNDPWSHILPSTELKWRYHEFEVDVGFLMIAEGCPSWWPLGMTRVAFVFVEYWDPLAHTGIIGPLVLGCVFLRPRSVCTSMRRWMMMACTCALTFYMVHLETVFYWGLMGHEVVPCEKGISPWSHSHGMMSKKCILKVIGFMTSCIPNMEQAKWPCTKKWMRWFSEYMFKIGSFGVFLHVWHSSFVAM